MDPLSITTACITLAGTIGKVSIQVNDFCRRVRDARRDLDAVSRELGSIKTTLEIIADDAQNPEFALPPHLEKQIGGIVANCGDVVNQIQRLLEKFDGGGLRRGIKWVVAGKDDMDRLRVCLEAHKSALDLGLELLTLSVVRETNTIAKDIRVETANVRIETGQILGETAEIKGDTTHIIAEIERLRIQLLNTGPVPGEYSRNLEEWLESLTSYADSGYAPSETNVGDADSRYTPLQTNVRTADLEKRNSAVQVLKPAYDFSRLQKLYGGSMPPVPQYTVPRRSDHVFNVAVIGLSGAGKSDLISMFGDHAIEKRTIHPKSGRRSTINTLDISTLYYAPFDLESCKFIEASKFTPSKDDFDLRPLSPNKALRIKANLIDIPFDPELTSGLLTLKERIKIFLEYSSMVLQIRLALDGFSSLDLALFVLSSEDPIPDAPSYGYESIKKSKEFSSRTAIIHTGCSGPDWEIHENDKEIIEKGGTTKRSKRMQQRQAKVYKRFKEQFQHFFIGNYPSEDGSYGKLLNMTAVADIINYIASLD